MKRILFSLCSLLMAGLLVAGCGSTNSELSSQPPASPTNQSDNQAQSPANQTTPPGQTPAVAKKQYSKPPAMQIDPNKTYTATVSTTMGDFKIQLFAKDAPKTVNNFVFLARDKFYDGLTFHRVIKDFMIQTGDPAGNGTGGPGYTFEDELNNGHQYEIGVVAMANSGPNTNGSQFFIGTGDQVTGLRNIPNYTIFGKVVAGMDVVEKIASVKVKPNPLNPSEISSPVEPVKIKTIRIEEK